MSVVCLPKKTRVLAQQHVLCGCESVEFEAAIGACNHSLSYLVLSSGGSGHHLGLRQYLAV